MDNIHTCSWNRYKADTAGVSGPKEEKTGPSAARGK